MSDLLELVAGLPMLVLAVAALLLLLLIVFIAWFIIPSARLRWKLGRFTRQVRELRRNAGADPRQIAVKDRWLAHLWLEYCGTLHLPSGSLNPATGVADTAAHRATVSAEAIFNGQSVFEDRIHTEFFKHLPGLLTGLGIIGTFLGLINGLGEATGKGGGLDTALLIGSVREAFNISAAAIGLAMMVTFVEKLVVARLHRAVARLCHDIDAQFSPGVGEEYLSRMATASEESASQARILKDALVGDLTAILERLQQQQIAAAAKEQEDLQRNLVSAIDQGLRQPLGEIAQGFTHFQGRQGDQLAQGLQDSMAAFAERLDQMLGGQIQLARDLQTQTLQSLTAAIGAFQSVAKDVGHAGEAATSAMVAQLTRVLEEMAARQGDMNTSMRELASELRSVVAQSQADTQSHVGRLLRELGEHVATLVGRLQAQAAASTAAHEERLAEMSTESRDTITALAESVRSQTSTLEEVTNGVRAAISELGASVSRIVSQMSEGAAEMRRAAEQFTRSGQGISEVFDRSQAVTSELSNLASSLSSSSRDVQAVVSDYRAARETFASIVDGLRGTVDAAKREVGMTSDLVSRLDAAAQKLIAAQGHAEQYLAKLNDVLAEAHGAFSSQMIETVRRTNTEFHDHLAKSTSLIASTIADLDGAIVEFAPRRKA